jgi:hypothetical protein
LEFAVFHKLSILLAGQKAIWRRSLAGPVTAPQATADPLNLSIFRSGRAPCPKGSGDRQRPRARYASKQVISVTVLDGSEDKKSPHPVAPEVIAAAALSFETLRSRFAVQLAASQLRLRARDGHGIGVVV